MHLALFTDGLYPYVVGGIQKHAQTLAIEWARRGIRVSLFHPGRGTDESAAVPLEGFSADIWPQIQEIVVPFPPAGRLPGHYVRENRAYSQALLNELERLPSRPDFVYAQALTGWALAEARQATEPALPPVCVSPHGLEMFQLAANWRSRAGQMLLRNPMRAVLRQADFVHSLGGKLTEILKQEGVEKDRIWEVSGGIDPDWFRSEVRPEHKHSQRWIFVGRFERRKGIQELQAVLPAVLEGNEVEMTFVGPIPEEVRISHPRVHYLGMVQDPSRIRAELDEADLLICPSYAEGMPIVIMEAMARGLAIVATDTGATRALVRADNGWCIEPAQPDSLKETLLAVSQTPASQLRNMKRASLKHIRSFSWDRINDRLLELIQRAISVSSLT